MSERVTFGIVGGYGATGRSAASRLLKSGDGNVHLGGRDAAKVNSLAAELGSRASAASLDILDSRSLDDFCERCSIVINCGGPVIVLQDRVAQAALRARCHYVDAAGMSIVKERILPHEPEITGSGLSFVISAGWMPGITEILPAYAHLQARARMDSIESVSVYYGDSGEWSDNALRDGTAYIRRVGLSRSRYFRKGESVLAKASEASSKVDLGDPIGRRRFGLFSMPEQDGLGRRFADCDFLAYSYVSGFRNVSAAFAIAILSLSEKSAIRLLRNVFRRNRLPVGGFVVAHVVGRLSDRLAALKASIVFEVGQDYWMNGIALATVARMISAGESVKAGVNFLSDAVDPFALLDALRQQGVRFSETFEFC